MHLHRVRVRVRVGVRVRVRVRVRVLSELARVVSKHEVLPLESHLSG